MDTNVNKGGAIMQNQVHSPTMAADIQKALVAKETRRSHTVHSKHFFETRIANDREAGRVWRVQPA
jgi:hypothetical protein